MKLLSITDKKDAQQKEQTLKILRTQEVEELASKANAKLARANADFQSSLALNRSKWAVEEQEHSERILGMSKEVEALEERKKQALIPISMYKTEADKIMAEAKEVFDKANEKDEQSDFLQEKLEEKLTAVADREREVSDKEQRNQIALQGIKLQQDQTRLGIENLQKQISEFQVKQQKDEASILERKIEVSMAEISFKAKTDKLKRDMEALRIWEAQLTDERETLARAMKRKS